MVRNHIYRLEVVKDRLLNPADTPHDLLGNAAGSLAGLRDPKAIPALTKLIEAKNSEINRGAAAALRQTGSTLALKPLARLLDDNDALVRYYAVVGLGEIIAPRRVDSKLRRFPREFWILPCSLEGVGRC
ncbi:MAG: HEAT repeat domain-containing protein [Terriglobales bacterium]